MLSDHREFHAVGIPFLKFGVELHRHYHEPTDTFARLNHGFYERVVHMLVGVATECDAKLDHIRRTHTEHKRLQQQTAAAASAAKLQQQQQDAPATAHAAATASPSASASPNLSAAAAVS